MGSSGLSASSMSVVVVAPSLPTAVSSPSTTSVASTAPRVIPQSGGYVIASGVLVGVAVLGWWAWSRLLPNVGTGQSVAGKKWRVDNTQMAAKAIAATAAGFITTLIAAVLTPDKQTGPWIAVLGCLAGAFGAMVYAALLLVAARDAADQLGP
jgi:hypothetical protein